jgi:DNA recombination protein RmuC
LGSGKMMIGRWAMEPAYFTEGASGLISVWTDVVKRVLTLFQSWFRRPASLMAPASPVAVFGGVAVSPLAAAMALLAVLVTLALIALWRAGAAGRRERYAAEERQQAIEERFAVLAQSSAELNGKVGAMAEWLGSRQADLARIVSERLDSVGARLGAGLESQAQTTGESLGRLNERLAVIDAAQSRLTEMTREVVSLKDILANKQTRGAFGQGRMEAIVRDGLPPRAYDFQFTLSNRARPDCVIRLPGDPRLLAVDAKFPLEGFSAFRAARDDEARRNADSRVRADVGKHVKDIADRYLVPGETQDVALMFVPSEAIYSDLVEHFDELVQKAHRARVVIVSPTLMMMAINVAQAILRDARMRDEAHEIQAEVGKLMNDVRLIVERAGKLEAHFRHAQEDLAGVGVASARIARRAERIESMDFADGDRAAAPDLMSLARQAE